MESTKRVLVVVFLYDKIIKQENFEIVKKKVILQPGAIDNKVREYKSRKAARFLISGQSILSFAQLRWLTNNKNIDRGKNKTTRKNRMPRKEWKKE